MTETSQGREAGLDALRGVLMLLGVLLHAACCFQGDANTAWPYRDVATSGVAIYVLIVVHIFRMPLFFVIAGYFAARTAMHRGASGLLRSRWSRVGIPLIMGVLVVVPLVELAFAWAITRAAGVGMVFTATWPPRGPAHLWFLEYLLVLSVIAAAVVAFANRRPGGVPSIAFAGVRFGTAGLGRLVGLGLGLGVLLLPMATPGFATPHGFVPELRLLVPYGYCFLLGWRLWSAPEARAAMRARAGRLVSTGIVLLHVAALAALMYWGAVAERRESALGIYVVTQMLSGLAVVFLTAGAFGWVERRFETPRAWTTAMADASYTIYVVHLPIVLVVVALLRPAPMSGTLKMFATTTLAFVASWWVYRVWRWVRPVGDRAAPR